MSFLLDTDTCIHDPLDTLIAAQAVARGAVLVSNNTREFKRVSGLRIENWAG